MANQRCHYEFSILIKIYFTVCVNVRLKHTHFSKHHAQCSFEINDLFDDDFQVIVIKNITSQNCDNSKVCRLILDDISIRDICTFVLKIFLNVMERNTHTLNIFFISNGCFIYYLYCILNKRECLKY